MERYTTVMGVKVMSFPDKDSPSDRKNQVSFRLVIAWRDGDAGFHVVVPGQAMPILVTLGTIVFDQVAEDVFQAVKRNRNIKGIERIEDVDDFTGKQQRFGDNLHAWSQSI